MSLLEPVPTSTATVILSMVCAFLLPHPVNHGLAIYNNQSTNSLQCLWRWGFTSGDLHLHRLLNNSLLQKPLVNRFNQFRWLAFALTPDLENSRWIRFILHRHASQGQVINLRRKLAAHNTPEKSHTSLEIINTSTSFQMMFANLVGIAILVMLPLKFRLSSLQTSNSSTYKVIGFPTTTALSQSA